MKKFRHYNRPKKSSLIVGANEVLDALKNGEQIEKIYIDSKTQNQDLNDIRKIANGKSVPLSFVPVAKLNSFNVPDHGGCIALKSRIQYLDVQDIISSVIDKGEAPFLLILDGITDIRNIGGIARTAYCTGVSAIIIPDKGVGILNEDAILTSAGALEKIPVCRVSSLMKTVDDLHMQGIKVYATEMKAEKKFTDCDFTEPVAIVIGSEEKGIYPALLKVCDEKIKIPMAGGFESLNVSVATGIILYEVMKQRMA